ncbi:MAG: glycosyltransferase [Anaerolineae bacterium]|nr:glycosyltransferase [Anaerolineae bacterium]
MKPTLTAYCFPWHITTSPAFRHLLVDPLVPFLNVDFVALPDLMNDTTEPLPTTQPIIFCQHLPFPAWLANESARIVWIPMWDQVHHFAQSWWDALPKTLRIVAFSDVVEARAQKAGLPTLKLRYAKKTADFPAVNWHTERTLMYWNRTGLASPSALRRLCEVLEVRRVFFRDNLDPYVPQSAAYHLPSRIGNATVQTIPNFMSHKSYLDLLAQSHILIAPRLKEGVGMTFLEAMAGGSVVCAADAPTMKEYIFHQQTGVLLAFDQAAEEHNARLYTYKRQRTLKRWRQRWFGPFFRHPITASNIPLDLLTQTDPETLGARARTSLAALYEKWQKQLAEYAQFILDW